MIALSSALKVLGLPVTNSAHFGDGDQPFRLILTGRFGAS
jgi:hypothetical protein